MSENFESGFPTANWTVYDKDGATNGELFWDEEDFKSYEGNYSAWPASGGANSRQPVQLYTNNMASWMVYGPFSLEDASAATLSFKYWLTSEEDHDFLLILASTDNITYHGYGKSGFFPEWHYQEFDLTTWPIFGDLTGEESVWLAFAFASDASTVGIGPFIDYINLKRYKVIPDTPAHVSATDGLYQQGIKVTWDESLGAASYKVYRATSLAGTKTLVGTTSKTYYTHSPVTYAGQSYYWVEACATAGCSGYSVQNAGFISKDTVGLYAPSSSIFKLNYQNVYKGADKIFTFYPTGMKPISGDWNGDGIDTIGLYDPATGIFRLRNLNSAGPAHRVFAFGPDTGAWLPLAGDWNGDGIDTIGVFNPTTRQFLLRNLNNPGPAHRSFTLSTLPAGCLPIAGDWNGTGVDTIGAYDPATATFYLRNYNSTGPIHNTFVYGPANWVPIAGDWNNNGTDTIGIYNPATGGFRLRNLNSAGPPHRWFMFGPTNLVPIAGNWENQ